VHQADPLLVPVQRRPVGQPGGRGRDGDGDAGADQHAGGAVGAAEQVQQDRRCPAAERQPHERGMDRLAERHAVQRVRPRAGRQGPDDSIGQPADHRVERVRLLEPLGHGGGLAGPAGLAVLARPAGRGEGWGHI
jgi:hypothetical protein